MSWCEPWTQSETAHAEIPRRVEEMNAERLRLPSTFTIASALAAPPYSRSGEGGVLVSHSVGGCLLERRKKWFCGTCRLCLALQKGLQRAAFSISRFDGVLIDA